MKKSIVIWTLVGGFMGIAGCGQIDTSITDHRSVSEHGLITNATREFCDERLEMGDACDVSDAFCCADGLVCADMVCVPDGDPQAT